MTAPRITAERIAELKRHYPRGAYSRNREHHPFGHIAYSTIDIHELIDALESAYTELATAHEEIILSRQSEGDTMADLLATREERDNLRAELDLLHSRQAAEGSGG
jgi:hypothetical protein